MVVITFDTETTGLLKDPQARIVEIGAVRHNIQTGEEIDTFQTFVKPPERWITPAKLALSKRICGIEPEQVLTAPEYPEVMSNFIEWIGFREVLYAWNLPFDSRMLLRYCKDAIGDCYHHDAIKWFSAFKFGGCWQRLYTLMNIDKADTFSDGNPKTINMRKTMVYEGWEGIQTHRALDDARLAANVGHLITKKLQTKNIEIQPEPLENNIDPDFL